MLNTVRSATNADLIGCGATGDILNSSPTAEQRWMERSENMGKKYIIKLPENTHWIQWIMESTKDHHPYMDFKQVEDLTPYTEPDTEKVKEEAYRQGYDTGYGTKVNEFYEQGLADAWEAARKIAISEESGGLTCREMQRIFCTDETDEIFDMSASEVIEKIRQYEQKEQESITAEDVMRQYLDTFCRERSCTGCILHTPDFTCGRGKSFLYGSMSDEEVRRAYAAVFAKMKEG